MDSNEGPVLLASAPAAAWFSSVDSPDGLEAAAPAAEEAVEFEVELEWVRAPLLVSSSSSNGFVDFSSNGFVDLTSNELSRTPVGRARVDCEDSAREAAPASATGGETSSEL